jgi:hypothetical protein
MLLSEGVVMEFKEAAVDDDDPVDTWDGASRAR